MRALDLLIDESCAVGVTVMADLDTQNLFYVEAHPMSIEPTVLIVDLHLSLGDLVRHEHVLIEDAGHGGGALINAAPCLDVASLGLSIAHNEVDGFLADDQHLLVLHGVVLVVGVQHSLDVVLHLGLGLLTRVLMFEVKRGGDVLGQLSLELNRVDAWVEHATLNIEDSVLVLEELL